MSLVHPRRLARRVSLVAVMVLFAVLVCTGATPRTSQAQGMATVNVPASILLVDCPGLPEHTVALQFAYIQLDGNVVVLDATNENLDIIQGIPSVIFYNLSIDWQGSDAIYRFHLDDGSYLDYYIPPGAWSRDAQSGIIFDIASCY